MGTESRNKTKQTKPQTRKPRPQTTARPKTATKKSPRKDSDVWVIPEDRWRLMLQVHPFRAPSSRSGGSDA